MGYVRPVYWYEGKDGKLHRDIESYEESGWRRQHAVTVWNAMAAVVMVIATYRIISCQVTCSRL